MISHEGKLCKIQKGCVMYILSLEKFQSSLTLVEYWNICFKFSLRKKVDNVL